MNRYEKYFSTKLDYNPYMPNFDKWGEVLSKYQTSFDTFNSTINNATPNALKQSSAWVDVWNNYLNTSKEQVKKSFMQSPQKGMEALKQSMFELQKEVKGGLFNALNTQATEYHKAIQDAQLDKQPEYRQEDFLLNLEKQAKNLDYDPKSRSFKHISLQIDPDPLLDKNLMEFTKSLVPPKVAKDLFSIDTSDSDGDGKPDNVWKLNRKILTQYMTEDQYATKVNEFIASNPAFQRDLAMRSRYNLRRMSEEDQKLIVASHNLKLEIKAQQEIGEFKDLIDNASNRAEAIKKFQISMGLEATGNLDTETKQKITELADAKTEAIRANKTNNPELAMSSKILSNLQSMYYNMIPNVYEESLDAEINPLWKIQHDDEQKMKEVLIKHQYDVQEALRDYQMKINLLDRKAAADARAADIKFARDIQLKELDNLYTAQKEAAGDAAKGQSGVVSEVRANEVTRTLSDIQEDLKIKQKTSTDKLQQILNNAGLGMVNHADMDHYIKTAYREDFTPEQRKNNARAILKHYAPSITAEEADIVMQEYQKAKTEAEDAQFSLNNFNKLYAVPNKNYKELFKQADYYHKDKLIKSEEEFISLINEGAKIQTEGGNSPDSPLVDFDYSSYKGKINNNNIKFGNQTSTIGYTALPTAKDPLYNPLKAITTAITTTANHKGFDDDIGSAVFHTSDGKTKTYSEATKLGIKIKQPKNSQLITRSGRVGVALTYEYTEDGETKTAVVEHIVKDPSLISGMKSAISDQLAVAVAQNKDELIKFLADARASAEGVPVIITDKDDKPINLVTTPISPKSPLKRVAGTDVIAPNGKTYAILYSGATKKYTFGVKLNNGDYKVTDNDTFFDNSTAARQGLGLLFTSKRVVLGSDNEKDETLTNEE